LNLEYYEVRLQRVKDAWVEEDAASLEKDRARREETRILNLNWKKKEYKSKWKAVNHHVIATNQVNTLQKELIACEAEAGRLLRLVSCEEAKAYRYLVELEALKEEGHAVGDRHFQEGYLAGKKAAKETESQKTPIANTMPDDGVFEGKVMEGLVEESKRGMQEWEERYHEASREKTILMEAKSEITSSLENERKASQQVNERCAALCNAAVRAKEEIFSLRAQLEAAEQGSGRVGEPRYKGGVGYQAENEELHLQVSSLRGELVQLYHWLSLKREQESRSPSLRAGRLGSGSPSPTGKKSFNDFDKNGDGAIDREEWLSKLGVQSPTRVPSPESGDPVARLSNYAKARRERSLGPSEEQFDGGISTVAKGASQDLERFISDVNRPRRGY